MLFAILLLFGLSQSHAKIVFHSKRNEDTLYHVYVMEDNGSNVRRVTSPDFYDRAPHWFPDGKRILFERDWSQGNGAVFNTEFYIIDANGRNEHRFMANHPADLDFALSPDGKQIAFSSLRSDVLEIYTYHLESGHLERLTDNRDTGARSHTMDWAPDGRKIAYDHESVEGDNIWIMNADGSGKRRLSPPEFDANTFLLRGAPRWSPSGTYIMYTEHRWKVDKDNWQRLFARVVVQTVRTGIRAVHNFPVEDTISPGCWMGNDQTVLLPIKKDPDAPAANYEIYRYDLVSRRLTNVTNEKVHDLGPHWISGTLSVVPAGKLTILWGQLKQADPKGWQDDLTH